GLVEGAGLALDLLPSGQDERAQPGRIDRPEIAPPGSEGVFEKERPGVEKRLDLARAHGFGMGEVGVTRVFPSDFDVEAVQLGPDLLALDFQGPALLLASPTAAEENLEAVRLQGQAAFEVALPHRERRVDAAPDRGAALAQDFEERTGARLLARLDGGAAEALAGTRSGEAHQDVDAELIGVAAGAAKDGAELGVAQPRAQ